MYDRMNKIFLLGISADNTFQKTWLHNWLQAPQNVLERPGC